MAHTYTKTVTLTPSSAQNSFSASNWSATNNALGNWVTVAQDPNDVTKWNITLTDNSAATQRTTTLTATHPDSVSVQDSFNITQAGSNTVADSTGGGMVSG